ncbi:hypothetical protein Zm00014a_019515 [Zea mays]|uniref:Uncharacterized protein n=1 Tax=Zea mays TaxID=4577 RepID=A0A3L6FAE3_MAIZE|nr:hypothetical protein Zm00014a_019515 [Zea mays]
MLCRRHQLLVGPLAMGALLPPRVAADTRGLLDVRCMIVWVVAALRLDTWRGVPRLGARGVLGRFQWAYLMMVPLRLR